MPRRVRILGRKKALTSYPKVLINDPTGNRKSHFPSNQITTTKYTLLNFLPKNLFEQFRRVTNIYFLCIVIITLIPAISPLTPWTSILPLAFVLGTTALKEGYEDFGRYKADNKVNNKKYYVMKRDGTFAKKPSKSLVVGDIVKIMSDQNFPSDIVPLVSALDDGVCFVETAQLDGETNLKIYKAPVATNNMDPEKIPNITGFIEAEVPNHRLYNFVGTLSVEGETHSLNYQNLLLRGATLRNTEWAIGVVVYTGKYTKLSLNQKLPPSKFSTVERRLNKAVIGIFVFKMGCVISMTVGSAVFNYEGVRDNWYLDIDISAAYQTVRDFFSYFALLSFMIPMSLMVTLEVVKVIQGKFMEWDKRMALDPDDVAETGMAVKTTNLNDELALVKYIFSDKTGTLTENRMIFQKVSINGVIYHEAGKGELKTELKGGSDNAEAIRDFLTNLSICHAAVPDVDEDTGDLVYKSQSPDEVALCDGSRLNGFTFKTRTQTDVTIEAMGETISFETLNVLEFTSDRRRMSVIVRLPESMGGGIRIYSKGADSMMLSLLRDGDDDIKQKTLDDIELFCKEGLRTLILGYKDVTEDEYEEWNTVFHKAETALEDRDNKIDEASKLMERDFIIIGATAIEDKLQDEVPETIYNLLRAGIKVWVITGDKQATAINIGHSCKLLKDSMEIMVCNAESSDECRDLLKSYVDRYCAHPRKRSDPELGLVVDGHTLNYALEEHAQLFLQITKLCHSVVCCRVTPIQKANIVKLIKENTHEVCLSIGDGANDVSMIQEAHIGVGIYGNEGTQAARSADYAIRQFRHLRCLITIHGRYSFLRNSGLIQYSIYKNAAAFLVQFWYGFYSGYSANTIYDDLIITLFNIIFTSVPPFFYAIFEKDIEPDIIDQYPEVFRRVQTGYQFSYSSLFVWVLNAIWHSIIFFFGGVILLGNEPFYGNGRSTGLRVMGNMVSTIAITIVILKCAIFTNHWNILVHCGIWGSISAYFLVFLVESYIPAIFRNQYHQFVICFQSPMFWLMFLVVIFVCLVPDIFGKFLQRELYPEDWQILQEAQQVKTLDKVDAALQRKLAADKNPDEIVEELDPEDA